MFRFSLKASEIEIRKDLIFTGFFDKFNKIIKTNETNNDQMENKINIYSLKLLESIIPKDINLNKILLLMIFKSNEFYLKNRMNKISNNYATHNNEYQENRKNILEYIKYFIDYYNLKYDVFYYSIFLYDYLTFLNDNKKYFSNQELIAISSLMLSIKFLNVEEYLIRMIDFKNIFEDKSFTETELKEAEILALKLLDYELIYPSPIHLLQIFTLKGIIFSSDNIDDKICIRVYNFLINTLGRILINNDNYFLYNSFKVICSIISYTREIFNLDKWNKILESFYGISFDEFEDIYINLFNIDKKDTRIITKYKRYNSSKNIENIFNYLIKEKPYLRRCFTQKKSNNNNKDDSKDDSKESKDKKKEINILKTQTQNKSPISANINKKEQKLIYIKSYEKSNRISQSQKQIKHNNKLNNFINFINVNNNSGHDLLNFSTSKSSKSFTSSKSYNKEHKFYKTIFNNDPKQNHIQKLMENKLHRIRDNKLNINNIKNNNKILINKSICLDYKMIQKNINLINECYNTNVNNSKISLKNSISTFKINEINQKEEEKCNLNNLNTKKNKVLDKSINLKKPNFKINHSRFLNMNLSNVLKDKIDIKNLEVLAHRKSCKINTNLSNNIHK